MTTLAVNLETDAEISTNSATSINSECAVKQRQVSTLGVFAFGLCSMVGPHFDLWNKGLYAGFWPMFYITLVVGMSYFCLVLSIAEVNSALPFSGGSYGIVRITLGNFAGYIVGTAETVQYIITVAFSIAKMSAIFTTITGYDRKYEPLYWIFLYAHVMVVLAFSDKLFWKSAYLLGAYMGVMMILLCTIVAADHAQFNLYSEEIDYYRTIPDDPLDNFFRFLPQGCWFFGAVKLIPLVNREAVKPHTSVPRGLYLSYAFALCSAIGVLFSCSSIYPGITFLRDAPVPLMFAHATIFNMVSYEKAMSFTVIAKWGICLAFSFAYARQIDALGTSGFVSRYGKFDRMTELAEQHPLVFAGAQGSLVGFFTILFIWKYNENYYEKCINACLLIAFMVNTSIFASHVMFKYKLGVLPALYRSPLSYPGAIIGMAIQIVLFISIAFLQRDDHVSLILYVIFMALVLLTYFVKYRKVQRFSSEEKSILFVAYVVNANRSRRSKIRKKSMLVSSQSSRASRSSGVYAGRNDARVHLSIDETEENETQEKDRKEKRSSKLEQQSRLNDTSCTEIAKSADSKDSLLWHVLQGEDYEKLLTMARTSSRYTILPAEEASTASSTNNVALDSELSDMEEAQKDSAGSSDILEFSATNETSRPIHVQQRKRIQKIKHRISRTFKDDFQFDEHTTGRIDEAMEEYFADDSSKIDDNSNNNNDADDVDDIETINATAKK